jgi:putative ABC transport system ATP-binding protein
MCAVHKRFPAPGGAVTALNDVSFTLMPGDFAAVTGPSGSGKSTLLHVATLLEPPTSGAVCLDGENVTVFSERRQASLRGHKIGVVFQRFCLLPHRTVLENVLFRFRYLRYEHAVALRMSCAALERVGLLSRRYHKARLLSGGEMQRTAIARAIAIPPRLLAADEPTGNLDSTAAEGVMECLKELNQQGVTILLVTHNHALLRHCSRHLRMEDGRMESV